MQIIQSKLLNSYDNLISGFTTKQNSNLAFHVNDTHSNVVHNHCLLAKSLGYTLSSLVHMKQIHSNNVHQVRKEDNFLNPPTCDALISNEKNIPLMVMVADCSPILFYDPILKVIAVAHAGREGAFSNIVHNVIESFTQVYASKTKDILVCVGANIKECCYEVGQEIYEQATHLGLEYSIRCQNNSYSLDLSSILHKQLLDSGITSQNIEFIKECSCCTSQHFSYRRESQTGREAGIIMLK